MLAEAVAHAAVQEAARTIPIAAGPTLQLGYSDEHTDFPGTISLTPEILLRIYVQVIDALHRSGPGGFLC